MKTKLLLSLGLLIATNAFSQIPTTNLIKEYTFTNGSLQNTVNPGTNDLTTVATTSTFTQTADPINTNNAIVLNGEQLLGGQHPTNAIIEADFSISFWIKTSYTGVNSQYIFRQYGIRNTNSNAGIRAYLNNGIIIFAGNFRLGTSNYNAETYLRSSSIADGNWHHIVITGAYKHRLHPVNPAYTLVKYDYKLYIDNILDKSGSTAEGFDYDQDVYLFEGNPDLKIGSVQFQDSMDSFRVYTSALSVNDIALLYQEFGSSLHAKDPKIKGLEIKTENRTIKTNLPQITIKVLNLLGQQVENQHLRGLYMVLFQNKNGVIQLEKILIP
ncbi:hypothetical protein FHR24_002297 [Wenyingzhuangia heitensis]|uniref:Concanavalin A-like lectin/glucanases superfamily protein n=1 Tax=Wenyingzhuangia heitensis TaxID=1487859 RepID=A0ABX0UF73_9FLAO|nr:LamG domain-containing protein [Wenyingzhuangia heitensis]NIJ45826.1 hypothetical protein [Wenyingzhuangia heitensis]